MKPVALVVLSLSLAPLTILSWDSLAQSSEFGVPNFFKKLSGEEQASSLWRGFHTEGPYLAVARVQTLKAKDLASCQNAPAQIQRLNWGLPGAPQSLKGWEPWTAESLEPISECREFPCKIKLSPEETSKLTTVTELSEESAQQKKGRIQSRFRAFLGALDKRLIQYLKTQKRPEYEYPGDPIDPWKWFDKIGLKSAQPRPDKAQLYSRIVSLKSDRFRPIRQILDKRETLVPKLQGTVWVRDVYTAHYFDSWGEWAQVNCDPENLRIQVVQILMLEFDLLKKTDFFSKVNHGKMREAIEENGNVYLDKSFKSMKLETVTQ